MNILLAFGLLTGVYMVHYEYPVFLDQPAFLGHVAHAAALRFVIMLVRRKSITRSSL